METGRIEFVDPTFLARPDRADEAAELLSRLQGEIAGREREALERIASSARRMRRSGRQARPIPQASWDAALELLEALARGALGEERLDERAWRRAQELTRQLEAGEVDPEAEAA